jgi:PhoH-like ATPase
MFTRRRFHLSTRKIFVLDTSVLLYDMHSIHSFPGNDIVIPIVVLDELDRFKDKHSLLGASARYVNRFLDDLRQYGNLDKGIEISNLLGFETDQVVRVDLNEEFPDDYPKSFAKDRGDNVILACGLNLQKINPDRIVKIVTKDINLRVKADSLNLQAEDYFADHVHINKNQMYSGVDSIELTHEEIDKIHDKGSISFYDDIEEIYPNQGIIGKSPEGSSVLAIAKNGQLKNTRREFQGMGGIVPKNKEQQFAVNMLMDTDISLVSISGIAGSGKTFLTLVCAMAQIMNGDYNRIIITRSIQPVGRDLGFLPGDLSEKMNPWLAPITDNFKHAFKDKDQTYFDMLIQRGTIEVAPLSYIRGRTFNDAIVIVDEAQNATIHELKTIITRIGKSSKVVLLGDTDQVDTPYIDSFSNGLTIVIEKMKSSSLTGHVTLSKGQRSDIASYAADIL